ncbi:hypothetical protein HNR73_000975 [Phytomonospora endophytica]|uniref:Uncharacterized protein n=1 Tax=Phytomonospora endophytica TaxID=714109 RepID=A0A841FH08_9ACTN|nr:hypothetical protein [Phytomonospora endophytica]
MRGRPRAKPCRFSGRGDVRPAGRTPVALLARRPRHAPAGRFRAGAHRRDGCISLHRRVAGCRRRPPRPAGGAADGGNAASPDRARGFPSRPAGQPRRAFAMPPFARAGLSPRLPALVPASFASDPRVAVFVVLSPYRDFWGPFGASGGVRFSHGRPPPHVALNSPSLLPHPPGQARLRPFVRLLARLPTPGPRTGTGTGTGGRARPHPSGGFVRAAQTHTVLHLTASPVSAGYAAAHGPLWGYCRWSSGHCGCGCRCSRCWGQRR